MTAPPTSVTQGYLNEYNGNPVVVTAIVFIILNTVFVCLRFLSRHLQNAAYGWDDAFIVPSWLANIGMCIAILLECLKFGGGHHLVYLEEHPELVPKRGVIDLYVEPIIYSVAVAFPKLSILVLYLRIFTDKMSRYICWLLIGIISVLAFINVFVTAFQCIPHAKAWDPELPGHCHNIEQHFIWGTFPNFVTDFVMLVIPLPVLYRLHVKVRIKVGLMLTFMVGSIGMITSIIRWSEYFDKRFIDGDQSWYDNPLEIWLVVEPSIYLMSACMLSYPQLFRSFVQSRLASLLSGLLNSRKSYTSFDDHQAGTRKRSFSRHRDKVSDPERSMILDPTNGSVASGNMSTERGEVMEMAAIPPGRIHVSRDVDVVS